jgi:TolA-binding protein
MSDPVRLREEGDSFEKGLLESAREDVAGKHVQRGVRAALGLGAAAYVRRAEPGPVVAAKGATPTPKPTPNPTPNPNPNPGPGPGPNPNPTSNPTPNANANPAPASSSLVAELVPLDAARAAFDSGNAALALEKLNRHDLDFPHGQLAPEAIALRVEIYDARHDNAKVLELTGRFLARYPSHPQAAQMRAIAEIAQRGEQRLPGP